MSIATSPPATTQNALFPPTRLPRDVPPVWRDMIAAEPRLIELENRARLRRRSRSRWRAYEALKHDLERLVGWHCRRPELGSSRHYEAAVDRILMALGV